MLLNELRNFELSANAGLADFYQEVPVQWAYHLDLKKWTKLGNDKEPQLRAVPSVKRTNAGTPMIVDDTAEYVLGMSLGDRATKAKKYHQQYLDQLTDAFRDGCTVVEKVSSFVTSKVKPPAGMAPTDRIVFIHGDGEAITADKAIQAFWAKKQSVRYVTGTPVACACCGAVRKTAEMASEWIKGVPGSLKGQCAMVTANGNAAERYGRTKAHGASLCFSCLRDATRGLNRLIKSDAAIVLGNVLVVSWGSPVPVKEALLNPTDKTCDNLRACAKAVDSVRVLVLSAHQARLVVRSFVREESDTMVERLVRWVSGQGDSPRSLLDSIGETDKGKKYRKAGLLTLLHPNGDVKKVSVGAITGVLDAVLEGMPLPQSLKAAAEYVMSLGEDAKKNEKRPDPLPAAAAVLQLADLYRLEGDMKPKINVIDTPAYRCGQLLGHLEYLQKKAIPGIGRTVADTAIRTTQTNPNAVLGQALINAKAHLSKLDKRNQAKAIMATINECIDGLEVPERFTATDQAAFCQGYYSVALLPFNKRVEEKVEEKATA